MVKAQFQNIDIQCWEHSRARSRSRTPRPYICLKGDADACDRLLAALDELTTKDVPPRRTLTLQPCQRPKACSTIQLLLSPVSVELKEMSLTRDRDRAIFELTPVGLAKFREAVVMWRDGVE